MHGGNSLAGLRQQGEGMLRITIRWAATAMLVAACTSGSALADSTSVPPAFAAPSTNSASIIGRASNGKTCRYLSVDRKVHCIYDDGTAREFIATEVIKPDFPAFGRGTRGSFTVRDDAEFAFLNGEFETRVSGSGSSTVCRLALRFRTRTGQTFWIWNEELHLGAGDQMAVVDSDGDGIADLAVAGQWDGAIDGSRRWWTPNPYDSAYPADARRYPARPAFSTVGGRNRGCKPTGARLAILSEAAANALNSIGDEMSVVLGAETDN